MVEMVRGTHLRADVPAVATPENPPVFPQIDSSIRAVQSIELTQRPSGAQWIIRYSDGGGRRASIETGAYLAPQLTSHEAASIAEAIYAGEEPLAEMQRFEADADRAGVSASLATLDQRLLADIGLEDAGIQRRLLGTDLASVRRENQWRRFGMDFRRMHR